MKITMNDENIVSIAQLKSFLKEVAVVNFSINNIGNKNKQEMCLGFGVPAIDPRGKEKKKYDTYLTPYEKLISLPNFEQYLKPEVSAFSLKAISLKQSDNESAQKMQNSKQKLLKNITL